MDESTPVTTVGSKKFGPVWPRPPAAQNLRAALHCIRQKVAHPLDVLRTNQRADFRIRNHGQNPGGVSASSRRISE